jgi:hypothetical protein
MVHLRDAPYWLQTVTTIGLPSPPRRLAAIDGSVPVDRAILVPGSHVAVVGYAEIVGVFMAVGGVLCSVERQTNSAARAGAILENFVQSISRFPFQNHQRRSA